MPGVDQGLAVGNSYRLLDHLRQTLSPGRRGLDQTQCLLGNQERLSAVDDVSSRESSSVRIIRIFLHAAGHEGGLVELGERRVRPKVLEGAGDEFKDPAFELRRELV